MHVPAAKSTALKNDLWLKTSKAIDPMVKAMYKTNGKNLADLPLLASEIRKEKSETTPSSVGLTGINTMIKPIAITAIIVISSQVSLIFSTSLFLPHSLTKDKHINGLCRKIVLFIDSINMFVIIWF